MDFGYNAGSDRRADGINTVKSKMFVLKALRNVSGGLSDISNTKLIGDLLYDMGCFDEAAYEYKKIIAFDPKNAAAYFKLAKCYSAMGYGKLSEDCSIIYHAAANSVYKRTDAFTEPDLIDFPMMMRSVERLIGRKEFDKALKILAHSEENDETKRLKAFCLFSLGNYAEALRICDNECDGTDVFSLAVAAASAYKLGDFTLAYSRIRTINRSCITTPGQFYAFAFGMKLCGENAYIIPVLEKMLEQHPYDSELMTFGTPLMYNTGNKRRAIQLCGDAIALDCRNYRARDYLRQIDDGAERLVEANGNPRSRLRAAFELREYIHKEHNCNAEERIARLFHEGGYDCQRVIISGIRRAHPGYEALFGLLALADTRADIKRNLIVESYCRFFRESAFLYKGRIMCLEKINIGGISYELIRPYLHAYFNQPLRIILHEIYVALSASGFRDPRCEVLSAATHCYVNSISGIAYDCNIVCNLYGAERGQVITLLEEIFAIAGNRLLSYPQSRIRLRN